MDIDAVAATGDFQASNPAILSLARTVALDAMGGLRINVERAIPIGGGSILNRNGRDTGNDYPITGYVPAGSDQLLGG